MELARTASDDPDLEARMVAGRKLLALLGLKAVPREHEHTAIQMALILLQPDLVAEIGSCSLKYEVQVDVDDESFPARYESSGAPTTGRSITIQESAVIEVKRQDGEVISHRRFGGDPAAQNQIYYSTPTTTYRGRVDLYLICQDILKAFPQETLEKLSRCSNRYLQVVSSNMLKSR